MGNPSKGYREEDDYPDQGTNVVASFQAGDVILIVGVAIFSGDVE